MSGLSLSNLQMSGPPYPTHPIFCYIVKGGFSVAILPSVDRSMDEVWQMPIVAQTEYTCGFNLTPIAVHGWLDL